MSNMENYPINIARPAPVLPQLIVVGLIVLVLAAILVPVFASAREKAREVSCLSNLKEQGLAALTYSQDWDNTLPAARGWMETLEPYVTKADNGLHGASIQSRFQCPDAVANYSGTLKNVYGYAYNSRLSRVKLDKVEAPAEMVMIFESSSLLRNADDPFRSVARPGRHYGGNVICFADGYARFANEWTLGNVRQAMEKDEPCLKEADIKAMSGAVR
jgi:hypothetical protein